MASIAQRITLEVERKFVPCANFIHHLQANKGTPQFRSLRYIKQSSFTDVYRDYKKELDSKGIWLRARGDKWQAKVRLGGDFINSQFEEIGDHDRIRSLVKKHIPQVDVDAPNFGLPVLANITTFRDEWLADDEYKVVLDRTDFGHEVGEVELEREYEPQDYSDEEQIWVFMKMDKDIERFMDKYSWAFRTTSQRPEGKLTAYFASQQQLGSAK